MWLKWISNQSLGYDSKELRLLQLENRIAILKDLNKNHKILRKAWPKWTTRFGHKIAIKNLSDSHLKNLVNFVKKGSGWDEAFTYELYYRERKVMIKNLRAEMLEIKNINI